jgi:microcystin-dependent protein
MKRLLTAVALAPALYLASVAITFAQEMYVGEVRLVGFNFCPTGWLQASGQTLAINQYTALFSLYGTTYGGDGRTNFLLPNLNGRAPYGSGVGGQPLGAYYGSTQTTLTVANLPSHNHTLNASSAAPSVDGPINGYLGTFTNANQKIYAPPGSPANATMGAGSVGFTGSNQPFSTQSPALAMMWCVAYTGIYPSRP